VVPLDQLPEVVFEGGWYAREFVPGQPDGDIWRWSMQEAFCQLENPRRAAAIYLEAQAPVDLLQTGQQVTIELDGQPVSTFEVTAEERFLRKFPVPDGIIHEQPFLPMTLRVGEAVVPSEIDGSGDERELGLKVFNLAIF
jgi:hypothetical protein